jgi:hypothetical protein
MYPKSHQMLDEQRWKKQATPRKDVHLSDLVQRLGGEGRLLVNKLFQVLDWLLLVNCTVTYACNRATG